MRAFSAGCKVFHYTNGPHLNSSRYFWNNEALANNLGANIDAVGGTALYTAVTLGRMDVAAELLRCDASMISAVYSSVNII